MNMSVVIVNWNVHYLLMRCLASVKAVARGFPGGTETVKFGNVTLLSVTEMLSAQFL